MPPWTRLRGALGTLLIVLVAIVSHAAELGHTLFVAHAVCEHGQLVHGREGAARDAKATPQDDVGPAVRGGEAVLAHDHCNPFSLTAPAVTVPRACLPTALLDPMLLPWAARPQTASAVVEVLAFAPKNSPPRG